MADLGKLIIGAGIVLVVLGTAIMLFGKIGGLPGDIHIRRGNFSFYVPIVTCIVLSLVLTLALQLIVRLRR